MILFALKQLQQCSRLNVSSRLFMVVTVLLMLSAQSFGKAIPGKPQYLPAKQQVDVSVVNRLVTYASLTYASVTNISDSTITKSQTGIQPPLVKLATVESTALSANDAQSPNQIPSPNQTLSANQRDSSYAAADTGVAESSIADSRGFDWGHLYVRIGIVVAGGLMLMSVLLSYFNRRLRREVEQRWRVEEKLQDSENRLSLALWGANLGCWDWDLDSGMVHIDAHGAEMLGGEAKAIDVDINQEDKIAEIFLSLVEDMDTDEVKAERHIKLCSGPRWVLIRGRRLRHGSGRSRAFGTVMDVSTDHAYQEKLVKLSITDPLTGLLNRRYFFDRLNQSCSHCQRDNNLISIALLDIDNFKGVNDKFGHLTGDQTLAQFAQMLKEDCRPYDLVARFGGEEFIILFFGMGKQQANKVLERYQERLRTTQIVADGNRLYCTFSCGIADSVEVAPGEIDPNMMVKLADERLYYAKEHGRNQIILESVA